ncbi:MAG: prolyl oligopeptidase family serine peptidase [Thermaerobacter sp.]|nr:prolyl oligopeptidase family serine peptidase [Thermaerobacter sp.]
MEFPRPDLDEFFRTYAIMGFALERDESRLVVSANISGRYNLWGVDLDCPYPYQLTYADQMPSQILTDPRGRFILAGVDQDGDEKTQIYAIPRSGGRLQPVRVSPGKTYFLAKISEDGRRIYYSTDRDNPQFLNICRYDLETDREEVLHVGEGASAALVAVSPDERSYVYVMHFSNTFQVPYLVSDGVVRCLTPDPTAAQNVHDVAFLDNATVVLTTNFGQDRAYLARFDLAAEQFSRWTSAAEELTGITLHRDSGTVYVAGSWGVQDRLYRVRMGSDELGVVPLPAAVIQQMECGTSGTLYLLGRSDVEPFNIWKLNGERWQPVTNNRVMGAGRDVLVPSETLRFPSFDGMEIESLWFKAQPAVAHGYTIVWPHGGPQAAERRMFRPFFQYALSRGYNIWAPNFRGSTGYGAEFEKLVEGDWGEGPRLDMMASVDWLTASGRASRDRLFVVGGSYGGYMTLLLHGRHAERFQAYVDIFGPSSLLSLYETVPEHWKPSMARWVGNPATDRERMVRESPITYLEQMTRPMLVIQGANDPRVVKAESDQIVEALRANGVEVEYLVLEDEGHGFQKKENEIRVYQRVIEFLDAHRNP